MSANIMATRRALLDLLERAKQLLREGKMPVNTTYYRGDPGCTTFTGAELDELAATARALAADGATTLQQRVLNYYTIHGTSDVGCDVNDVAAGLGMPLLFVMAAVDLLSSEGQLHSTIDEDHHKSTASDSEEELAAASADEDYFEMGETLSEEERARRAKAKAEREGNVQDISDDDSDVEDALTPFEQRILVYYKEFATSDEGLDINAVAAGLGTTTFQVRSAVYFLEGQGELYSTIDDDHHKYTAF